MAAGPAWDWATLHNLYPNVESYATYLRALKAFFRKHPDDTGARFLQAYYNFGGHREAAIRELAMVVRFEYNDPVAVALLKKAVSFYSIRSSHPCRALLTQIVFLLRISQLARHEFRLMG